VLVEGGGREGVQIGVNQEHSVLWFAEKLNYVSGKKSQENIPALGFHRTGETLTFFTFASHTNLGQGG